MIKPHNKIGARRVEVIMKNREIKMRGISIKKTIDLNKFEDPNNVELENGARQRPALSYWIEISRD
jgi:hypothetical protein